MILSWVLIVIFLSESYGEKCLTCKDGDCLENSMLLECNRNTPQLPLASLLTLETDMEHSQFGCLNLTYIDQENHQHHLKQCVILPPKLNICEIMSSQVKIEHCSVRKFLALEDSAKEPEYSPIESDHSRFIITNIEDGHNTENSAITMPSMSQATNKQPSYSASDPATSKSAAKSPKGILSAKLNTDTSITDPSASPSTNVSPTDNPSSTPASPPTPPNPTTDPTASPSTNVSPTDNPSSTPASPPTPPNPTTDPTVSPSTNVSPTDNPASTPTSPTTSTKPSPPTGGSKSTTASPSTPTTYPSTNPSTNVSPTSTNPTKKPGNGSGKNLHINTFLLGSAILFVCFSIHKLS